MAAKVTVFYIGHLSISRSFVFKLAPRSAVQSSARRDEIHFPFFDGFLDFDLQLIQSRHWFLPRFA
jgi:hypothetical protein